MADIRLLPQRADAADVVANCGMVVEPENASAMAHAVVRLVGDAALRIKLGAAGRACAEEFLNRDGEVQDLGLRTYD